MARELPADAQEAMNAEAAAEGAVILLTITHADLPSAIRLADRATVKFTADPPTYGCISRGETFLWVPISVVPPDASRGDPKGRLVIDNVGGVDPETGEFRRASDVIRSTITPADVLIEVVLMIDPDVLVATFPVLQIGKAVYDATSVTLELAVEDFMDEPFPAGRFSPGVAPTLHS